MPERFRSGTQVFLLLSVLAYSFPALASRLVTDGWLNRAPMEALLGEHLSGARDHGNRLWLLLNSEVWYRMHVLGQDRSELADELHALAPPAAEPALAQARAG